MQSAPPHHWRLALLSVFGVTALVHFPAVGNFFDNDDAWNYVLEAERLLAGQGSAWVEGGAYLLHQNALRLFTSLTYVARWWLAELWMPAWHLPSIVGHGVAAALLVEVSRRMGASVVASVLAGLLWGLSPLHPQTVAWIGGAYDVFCAIFLLGTVLAFSERRTRLGGLLCLLALTSKETGVFTGAILLGWVLAFERDRGVVAGVKRLAPYAAVTAAVLAARVGQVAWGGSIDQAGLPARTVGVDATSLFLDGPVALLAGLGKPFAALPLEIVALAIGVGVLLVLGLGIRRFPQRRLVLLSLGGAYLLLVPVLLLREGGRAFAASDILMHARYLYLPTLMAMPAVATALVGALPKPHALARVLAVVGVGASLWGTGKAVVQLTQVDPAGKVVADRLLAESFEPGQRVHLLVNTMDPTAYRLAMSRWLAWRTKAEFVWVQRGWWRTLQRNPDVPFGLDFRDFYVKQGPRFSPERVRAGDRVMLLRHGGPDGGHALENVELPESSTPGRVEALKPQWSVEAAPRPATATPYPSGRVDFVVADGPVEPLGWSHRPLVISRDLWLSSRQVWGLRLRYRAWGAKPVDLHGVESRYARGYAELHWTSEGVRADDSFVVLPLNTSGQEQVLDVPLWFDPVWKASRSVARIGLHPYDRPVQLSVLGIDVIYEEPR